MLELHKPPPKEEMGEEPPGKTFSVTTDNSMPIFLFLHLYEINHVYEMYKTVLQRNYFYTEMLQHHE
jgi:hypothetical protein